TSLWNSKCDIAAPAGNERAGNNGKGLFRRGGTECHCDESTGTGINRTCGFSSVFVFSCKCCPKLRLIDTSTRVTELQRRISEYDGCSLVSLICQGSQDDYHLPTSF